MSVYLDSCIIIYLTEGEPEVREAARTLVAGYDPVPLFTSQLTRIECRVNPLRDGDLDLVQRYNALFDGGLPAVEIDRRVVDIATDLRARYGFKVPDAIHLATAIAWEASAYLSNDGDLTRCREITVRVLPTTD